MTTPWTIKPIWKGETVAVLASGPSMSQTVADEMRQHKCIAVNHTHRFAPWADMLVVMDLNLDIFAEARHFAGMKVCGVASDAVDALYAGPMHERVLMGTNHVIGIRNSGLAAIRIAAAMGAAKIVLAGFDPDLALTGKYIGLAQGLTALIAELSARGIVVEQCISGSGVGTALPEVQMSTYPASAAKLAVKYGRSKRRKSANV
jgi:hypothetical protein